MGWTKAQQRAIDERKSNILVSAAAGSGKTAVLVERIINKMTDESNPKDIDEFLVVTFTKAAARQMREKIAARIEKMLEKEPDNEHLMKQAVLVNRADITTIDSFCLRLVKENFGLLGIDANFNIGDSGMMELIKNDVLDTMFDKLYEEKNRDFFMLLDIFGDDRNDDNLKSNILNIYRCASSFPRPYVWLDKAKEVLKVEDEKTLMSLNWVKDFFALVKAYTESAMAYAKEGKALCEEEGGPDKNLFASESDLEALEKIYNSKSYDELKASLDIKWTRLKTCKGDLYSEELVEEYKSIREKYKDIVKKLKVIKNDSNTVIKEMKNTASYLVPLLNLVIEFSDEYEAEKRKRKLVEFSDVEHMAYKLVCAGYDEDGKPLSTELARGISEKYDEIFIDEYQDSNYLQEDILYSVSGIEQGRYNMFMVGDVKQSIYKFRMARPDLFISKYKTFKDEGNEIKIELKNNFRSRKNVLETINYFCYQLIHDDLGGIEYDESVALVPTKKYPDSKLPASKKSDKQTEILLVDYFETEDRLSKLSLEANVIAKRINELVNDENPEYIYDEEKDKYRKVSYKDIVILSRSIKGFGETVYNILTEAGIPAYLEDSGGYFEAVEIKLIMSLLSVVDNIRQDIPLAAVLLSPIGMLDENELSLVCDYAEKNLSKKQLLCDKCWCYIEDNRDGISDKLIRIFDIINTLKQDNKTMSISSLIWEALTLTDYYNYAMAMPMGNRRKNNINMLLEKAYSFEDGAYKGLFNFLRYIEKLKINEVDFGEAAMFGDDEDVVRIITMHKSKGLEYPIVFASGFGKQFNNGDYKEQLIIHSDYYLASYFIDKENRYKKNTFIRDVFKLLIKKENMAEELRVLYVALTRAKEKLIITGCDKDVDKTLQKLSAIKKDDNKLPFDIRFNAPCFLYWILACMSGYEKEKSGCDIELKILREDDVAGYLGADRAKKTWSLYDFYEQALSDYDKKLYEKYNALFSFKYPFEKYSGIKNKMSISEIKRMKNFDGTDYEIEEDLSEVLNQEPYKREEKMDETIEKTKKMSDISGAERGTIIHKFMELFDFKKVKDIEENKLLEYIKSTIKDMQDKAYFSEKEITVINPYKIKSMLLSGLGKRMTEADVKGNLKKEQQFSAGLMVEMIYGNEYKTEDADDLVIVQGIIDAFFYEGDKIVLMDYKTDYTDEETLVKRYKAQLDYYAYILEKITGLKVSEKLIYSFYLEKQIDIA